MNLRSLLETWLRTRYGFPIVVTGAVALMGFNEVIYQHSRARLSGGINLTDIRIEAARTLQLITDAEGAVRGYLLTGRAPYIAPYRSAIEKLPAVQDQAFHLIERVDTDHQIGVDAVKTLIVAKLAELRTVVELYDKGQHDEAISMVVSDYGVDKMAELRAAFDAVLAQAASLQQSARISIYDAMQLNRLSVHLMSVVALFGLYFFMRQLRQNDLMRRHEKEVLEAQVKVRTAELSELAGHLVTAREDERSRLARELHDELGALFTVMKLEFARVRRVPDLPKGMQDRVASIEQRLNDGIAFKRRIVENLRPSALDQLGLVTSVGLLCQDSARAIGIPVDEDLQAVDVAPEVELTIYRVVQESLTNMGKYARASRASVSMRSVGGGVQLLVTDDGQGFDPTAIGPGHYGLIGMRFRVESHGGSLQVDAEPGRGTRVVVSLPARSGAA